MRWAPHCLFGHSGDSCIGVTLNPPQHASQPSGVATEPRLVPGHVKPPHQAVMCSSALGSSDPRLWCDEWHRGGSQLTVEAERPKDGLSRGFYAQLPLQNQADVGAPNSVPRGARRFLLVDSTASKQNFKRKVTESLNYHMKEETIFSKTPWMGNGFHLDIFVKKSSSLTDDTLLYMSVCTCTHIHMHIHQFPFLYQKYVEVINVVAVLKSCK